MHMYVYFLQLRTIDYVPPHFGGEPAGGNKASGPIGSEDTSRIIISMVSSVQWGTHLWACKAHEVKEVGTASSDGISIFILHMRARTRRHALTHAGMHSHTQACTHTHTHACTYSQTNTHTHTHMYIHRHAHTHQ